MTHKEIGFFQTMLDSKEQELLAQLRRREGIIIEKSPDALDEVHISAERELATRNWNGNRWSCVTSAPPWSESQEALSARAPIVRRRSA